LFFPIGTTGRAVDEIAMAKEICTTCDVRSQCLDYALRTDQDFGIWGGFDEDERRRLRQRHPLVVSRSNPLTHRHRSLPLPPATSSR